MSEEGYFYGIQWPAAMVKRKSDGKILSVSRKKIRVYEKQYTCPLDQKATYDGDVQLDLQEIKDVFSSEEVEHSSSGGDLPLVRPELDKNMVQSMKSLREHRFLLPGKRPRDATTLEESAMSMNDQGGEGMYVDSTMSTEAIGRLTSLLDEAHSAAEDVSPGMRNELLKHW